MDGVDVGPPKWCVCGRGLNLSDHEGMNDISNVKVQWKCKYHKYSTVLHVRELIKLFSVDLSPVVQRTVSLTTSLRRQR